MLKLKVNLIVNNRLQIDKIKMESIQGKKVSPSIGDCERFESN